MKKKLVITTIMTALLLSLTACGSDEEMTNRIQTSDAESAYLNGIEEGGLYVLHKDGIYEPTVFNNATFTRGETTSMPSTKRVVWFKEDFENIPTVYEGTDKLVFYSSTSAYEEIILERYKDLGITVGICGLGALESGKYSIKTNAGENNTFPNSDADAILNFQSESLIVDNVQGIPLRTDEYLKINKEKNIDYENTKGVTEYGTITNLEPRKYYNFDFYEGTRKNGIKLLSDVHALGSCTIFKGLNYHFTDDYLQEFELPDGLKTGYYSINALGVFRYIANGDAYTTTTDYNVGIEEENNGDAYKEEEEEEVYTRPHEESIVEGTSRKDEIVEKANEQIVPEEKPQRDVVERKYDVETSEAYVRFILTLATEAVNDTSTHATITTSGGVELDMYRINTTGSFYLDTYIDTPGQFTITMENMSKYDPGLQIKEIDESEVRNGEIG